MPHDTRMGKDRAVAININQTPYSFVGAFYDFMNYVTYVRVFCCLYCHRMNCCRCGCRCSIVYLPGACWLLFLPLFTLAHGSRTKLFAHAKRFVRPETLLFLVLLLLLLLFAQNNNYVGGNWRTCTLERVVFVRPEDFCQSDKNSAGAISGAPQEPKLL